MDLKYKIAGALGCSLEWLDFVLYGFFSPIIATHFFPANANPLTNLINTFGIFAIGFLARPIGGILFGYISEKYGRTKTLKFTPITLSCLTGCIGLIPSYALIGNVAIMLLFLLRFGQGICMGGECSSSIVYLVESSLKKPYFWGSVGSCMGGLGILSASFFASVYFSAFFNSPYTWLWRVVFMLTIPIGGLIYLARRHMPEYDPEGEAVNQPKVFFFKQKKLIALTTGILCLHASSFYFTFMYIPNFLIHFRHMETASAMVNNTVFLLLQLTLIPVFGLIADKIGGRKIAFSSTVLFLALSAFLYRMITVGDYHQVYMIMIVLCLLISANAGVLPTIILKKLPEKGRTFIFSVAFNLAFAVFGGLVPYICLSFVAHTSVNSLLPAYYLTATGLITLFSLLVFVFKKEAYGHSRNVGNSLPSC